MIQPIVNELSRIPIHFDTCATMDKLADSSINYLLASNEMVPIQWSETHRGHLPNSERHLLWAILFCAWEDLASPCGRLRIEAEDFFMNADAGQPVSLRFLCEALELDSKVVQAMARARLAAGVQRGPRRRRTGSKRPRIARPDSL